MRALYRFPRVALMVCCSLMACAIVWAHKSQNNNRNEMTIQAGPGVYSVEAHDVPLADVLAQLSQISGTKFDIGEGLNQKVTVNVRNASVESLLQQLTPGQALVYEKTETGYRLTKASLAAKQEPVKTAEAPDAGLPSRVRNIALGSGVLRNSARSPGELMTRDGLAILLENALIDTKAAQAGHALPVPDRFKAPSNTKHYIVQFDHRVLPAERAALEAAGAVVSHSVPNFAYAVTMDPSLLKTVQALPGVALVEPIHPYFKMSRDVLAHMVGPSTTEIEERVNEGRYNVLTYTGTDAQPDWSALGAEIVRQQSVDGHLVVSVKMPPAKLEQLVRADEVQWVETVYPRKAMNDLAKTRIRARALKALHPSLTGEGVVVGLTDSGIDFVNPGFADDQNLPTTTNVNSRIKYYVYREGFSSDGIPGDNNGHGTHVAGTILGNGALSATVLKAPGSGTAPYGTNQFAGIAPRASLVMVEDFNSFSDLEQASIAYGQGARLSNNSWGNSLYQYDSLSQTWDALVRDADQNSANGNQEYIAFFAAGNDGDGLDDGTGGTAGTVGEPGNAKNVITVGAVEQQRFANNIVGLNITSGSNVLRTIYSDKESDSDWQVASFSSRGPVTPTDPRVKPDIVAPGAFVLSIQSHETMPDDFFDELHQDYRDGNVNSGTNFAFFSGTSMATPVTAGGGALIQQYYTNAFGRLPSPALMKAMMVNGSRMLNSLKYHYTPYGAEPEIVQQGWGMLDVERAVEGPQAHSTDQLLLLDQQDTTLLNTGDTYTRQFTVNSGEGGLRIVLAWTDKPGTPGSARQLKNDLDLFVLAPGGGGYLGNFFDGDGVHNYKFSTFGQEYVDFYGDTYNNVEIITIKNAPVGTYSIKVHGYDVTEGPQDFALVVMKGIGIQGRTPGDDVSVAVDTNDYPVIAYSSDNWFLTSTQRVIQVRQWQGSYGTMADFGTWRRLEDQWFSIRGSADFSGVSRQLGDSLEPSVAVDRQNIYVAWTQQPQPQDTSTPDRIFLRKFDGADWVELANSANGLGISGNATYDASKPVVKVLSGSFFPIVAWRQATASGWKPFFAQYNGSFWQGLGGSLTGGLPGATAAVNLDMVVDSSGLPVVAWEESIDQRIHVRRWNGSAWADLGNVGYAPYAAAPSLAAGKNGDLYLAWEQYPNGLGSNYFIQAYAAKFSGGVWSGLGNSTNYPGVSLATNETMQALHPVISFAPINSGVTLAWQAGSNVLNSIFVKRWDGNTWSPVGNAATPPGISLQGGQSLRPEMALDSKGLPFVSYFNNGSTSNEVMTFTVIGDRNYPLFDGLQTAMGGTNGTVSLGWLAATDDVSSTIIYHIYRSSGSVACGSAPNCSANDVFSNRIASVTNATTFTVSGLVNGQVYCFGVRAADTNGLVDVNTATRSAGPVAGGGDSDSDCLANALEVLAGTEPCVKDTDGDGMEDGWEWTYSTNNPSHPSYTNAAFPHLNPLDNGLDNIRTLAVADGTPENLPDADPDGDGASNLEEFQWWLKAIHTNGTCEAGSPTNRVSPNPTVADTDGDGLPDGWEIFNQLSVTSSPNPTVSDAGADADGDGATTLQEYQNGSDPNNPDSDSDGVSDGAEIAAGTYPNLADSDQDGLDDGFEAQVGTNPKKADSNGNGVSDGDIYQLGFDSPGAAVTNLNTFLFENFETVSRSNWTHYATTPFVPFDLWHVSTAEPQAKTNAIGYLYDHSTSTAYRVAIDPSGTNANATYSMGSVIACALQSPLIGATNVNNLFVGWNEFFATEPNKDFVTVQARGGANTNWVTVSTSLSGISSGWVHRVANISQFAGAANAQVRFFFNAQNAINNEFAGWYVDDVSVYAGVPNVIGWVRDINGRPLQNVKVQAIGRGGVTNAVNGHRIVHAGKIFGEGTTAADGSYTIVGLPFGKYYFKASDPAYIDEFWNGPLVKNGGTNYGFGQQLNAGVPYISQVGTGGYFNAIGVTNAPEIQFELEKGNSASFLGVMFSNAGGVSLPVLADSLAQTVWNGSTSSPALVTMTTSNALTLANNEPDWLTNVVKPTMQNHLAVGDHVIYGGTNFAGYPLPSVRLREGETELVNIYTNQGAGRLFVSVGDGRRYRVSVDGFTTTNLTPALLQLRAGPHEVSLAPTSGIARVTTHAVIVPIGYRVATTFTSNELTGATGFLYVNAVDVNGNTVTNASIYVNGRLVASNETTSLVSGTPTEINSLRPGDYTIQLAKDGYRQSELRRVTIYAGVSNSTAFVLFDSDDDYDRVGDFTEVSGYTNLFLYHRDNDPDGDGLNNLQEFDAFRLNNVRLNAFDADSDDDRMPDGAELGYDGYTNRYAVSTINTNAAVNAPFLTSFFVGRFLEGVDNFGTGNVAAAISCDRFAANNLEHSNAVPPTTTRAITRFINIPSGVKDRSVSLGHNANEVIRGDAQPDNVDTDGDGMWDGFEYLYGRSTTAKLDVIECSDLNADSDFDGLSNYEEFLGPDHQANTNDWSNPTRADSDNDGIPDGWEYFYGTDPNNASDALVDLDGDGLVNLSEYLVGTNPRLADTDADYLDDGLEVIVYGTDPLDFDTDNDGLIDGREVRDRNLDGVADGGFFPNWTAGSDIDNDGLNDGPTDWDTDGDGMPDGFEVIDNFGNIRNPALNPFDPNDGSIDSDGDGLSNLQEFLIRDSLFGNDPASFGLTGVIWDYSTDPFNADTDGDGIPDGFEALYGLHPVDPIPFLASPETTNLLTRYAALGPSGDLDSDGLWNDREYRIRFLLNPSASTNAAIDQSTHPWNPDTDGDGLVDGEEDRALRSHPILQDTDQDRLRDGQADTNTWAEVETAERISEYALVYCTNCTWEEAYTQAQVPHPGYPDIVGHLAVLADTDGTLSENLDVFANYITPDVTNAAIGAVNNGDTTEGWKWSGGAIFNAAELANVNPPGVTAGQNNYLVMLPTGLWTAVAPTQQLSHYIIEWDFVPSVTTHFDQAQSDLWKMTWPDASPMPLWEAVTPEPGTLVPPARWGHAASYVPTFETKKPKDSAKSGTLLMDNRKLVLMGGRNGVTKFGDTWEFLVRSNAWVASSMPLNSGAGFIDGLSELSAIPFYGYHNTKATGCSCDSGVPYDCDGEEFLEPKNRPWSSNRSFDWTYVFGGWDEQRAYYLTAPLSFYHSTDDGDYVDVLKNVAEGTEYVHTEVVIDGTNAPVYSVPKVLVDTHSDEEHDLPRRIIGGPKKVIYSVIDGTKATYSTNTYLGTNGFYFTGLGGLGGSCELMRSAVLELPIYQTAASPVDINIFAEYDADVDNSDNYTENPPSARFTPAWSFNSSTIVTQIPAGATGMFPIDVTKIVQETFGAPGFTRSKIGFVITSSVTGAVVEIRPLLTQLRLTIHPSFAVDAYWAGPDSILSVYTTHPIGARKSAALALDTVNQKMLLFGGIDGNDVLGDTHEGVVAFNGAFEPKKITWTEKVTDISPPARWGASIIHDPKNTRFLLFGGFDKDHHPLNDLWAYVDTTVTTITTNGDTVATNSTITSAWQEITSFADTHRPQPRGGASLMNYGGVDYTRGIADYCAGAQDGNILLFGGTDGNHYFNDLWMYDGKRWILAQPSGLHSRGPSPRAFASLTWAQNGRDLPDAVGKGEWSPGSPVDCADSCAFLFGGRTGTLPTSRDTDFDMVDDGVEYELGGPAAGRDPRVNKLFSPLDPNEIVPFNYLLIGSIPVLGLNPRGAYADFESLKNVDAVYAAGLDLPVEYLKEPEDGTQTVLPPVGVRGVTPDMVDLWYHRYSLENPFNPKDVWELGTPNNTGVGSNGAPPYAYSGRWVFGTDLNGFYPNNAIMELYSPKFDLTIPPAAGAAVSTDYSTSYHLVYHEWVDLAGSGDVIRVEVVRPGTPADVNQRVTALNKPVLKIVPDRDSSANTKGKWRRVIAPLDIVANETNLYLRFTLQTDSSGVAGGWYIDDFAIVQGGNISGYLTNGPNVEVALYGVNFNNNIFSNTMTDANGLFQFGLLPVGQYCYGAGSASVCPIVIDPLNPSVDLGSTNFENVVISSIAGVHPTAITWPTAPGLTYELDYTTNILCGTCWSLLSVDTASSTNETYLDYDGDGMRQYRVLLINGL